MATYKYHCDTCGEFTVEMPMSEYKALEECPTCKGKVQRIIGTPMTMIFKGSGFYVNDYKKSGSSECNSGNCSSGNNSSQSCCSQGKPCCSE